MTDRELRQMGRRDLLEIIFQYQKREAALEKENADLRRRLEDRRTGIERAGSIAEAALALNGVFEAAQAAADQYLGEIRSLHADRNAMLLSFMDEARIEADAVLQQARRECDAMRRKTADECDAIRREAIARAEAGQ